MLALVSTDFRLYHGNHLELLAGVLADELARPCAADAVLAPETILIPQPAMRRWLQQTLAESHGIAANLRFLAPGEFVREALDANVPGAGDASVGDAATLRWRLWSLLADPVLMRTPVFAPLQAALGAGDDPLAAWSLAGELAGAFEKYQAWRRPWLRAWDRGADRDDWQAELWRRATAGLSHRGKRLDAYLARLKAADWMPQGLPSRVFAFACQNVSPDVLRVLASTARAGILHFFMLSPVAGWWGDLVTARERLHADPERVFDDDDHPLLRANGAAGRDFVRTLFSYEVVHPTFELPVYSAPDARAHPGLLHRLQADLLARRPPPASGTGAALPDFLTDPNADRSLQVHACHTRLREVQVLHDQLRALLEADPALQPRDIAVLTPDIDLYAAHVHAVFGGHDELLQQIPYALGDGSLLASHPLSEAFMRLLGLPGARFTASEVLEWLAVPAVAQRLNLEAAEFAALHGWLREAGARWAIDAEHRVALGAPAESAYTWAWALDRMMLGYASGDSADIAGIAPWPQLEGSALQTLDALLQGLHRFVQLQRGFSGRHAAAQWQSRLAQAVDALFGENPAEAGDRQAVQALHAQIAVFGKQTQASGLQADIPLAVVQAWFAAALADSDSRQAFLTGGVTFGRMVPMRLVPFKVICLLGMNDGEFPRRDPAGSLNRLSAELGTARRLPGDRSVREDDRGLFLQLFTAASEVFYVSYLGRDPRSGDDLPPSVVVAELLETASCYFAEPEVAREALTVAHPLQPFAGAAFGDGDIRRVSYQANWRLAAGAGDHDRLPMPAFAAAVLPDIHAAVLPDTDATVMPEIAAAALMPISRDRLFRGLSHPLREFLSARLGLRLPEAGEQLPDSEPFDAGDGLHRYALKQQVFAAAIAVEAVDGAVLFRRLLAEGRVAPGAAGLREVKAMLDHLAPAVATWRGWGLDAAQSLAYDIAIGEHRLTGALGNVHATGLRQFSASKGHGKTQLGLGIDALVWSALGHTRPILRLVSDAPAQEIAPLAPAAAIDHLQRLLAIYVQAQREPLAFMPRAGFEYFSRLPGAGAWAAGERAWLDRGGHGDGQDRWVQLALRGIDPFLDRHGGSRLRFEQMAVEIFAGLPGLRGADASMPALAFTPANGSPS